MLAAHPTVYTPEHEAHKGQHESAYFSSLVPYCRNAKSEADRRALSAIFERSDFWHLLFPGDPPVLDVDSLGIYGYFREAMDKAAIQRGCSHWLEKTPAHTVFLRDLIRAYPCARFVAVQRDPVDAVRSNVYRSANPHQLRRWVQSAIWGEVYRKILSLHREDLLLIRYEDLQADFSRETSRLYDHIGLDAGEVRESSWARDSTFSREVPNVPLRFRIVIQLIEMVFRAMPAKWCEWAARAVMKRRRPLPPWFFRVFQGVRAK